MDEPGGSPTAHKAKNGKFKFTTEIESKILDACGSGFTIEKAGALVGVNPSTIRTWIQRMPKFSEKVETARKNHELSLLKSIEQAGEKSWQAKAWLAERIYHHAIPSSRLTVDTSVTHNAGAGFAQLLAGLASRRAEKKAQVIDAQEVRAIEDSRKSQSMLNKKTSYNTSYATLATNPGIDKSLNDNDKQNHQKLSDVTSRKLRNKPMRRRKPRSESLAKYPPDTTTPPATPPAPV
jgi:hypothetical protein